MREDGGERARSWYLSREEVERGSPSRRDGVSAAKEAELRGTYCCFIRDVCARLRLPQITLATAILLCHRFYLRQSHAKNEWQVRLPTRFAWRLRGAGHRPTFFPEFFYI